MMNSIKVNISKSLMFLAMVFSLNVMAEVAPYRVVEIDSSNIRIALDGTGIVKGINCNGCDFNLVNITESSKASIQGAEVDILQVRNIKAGTILMVSFNPETRVVQYIRW